MDMKEHKMSLYNDIVEIKDKNIDRLFNKFEEFFDAIYNAYPDEHAFVKYKALLWFARDKNKWDVADRIAQSIIIFSNEILKKNDKFFLEYPMTDVSTLSEYDMLIVRIRALWNTSSKISKENIWEFLRMFVGLIKKIYSEDELQIIRFKGIMALLKSHMLKTVAGSVIYNAYTEMANRSFVTKPVNVELIQTFVTTLSTKYKGEFEMLKTHLNGDKFIGFQAVKTMDSGLFDWIENCWKNLDKMTRITIYRYFSSIMKKFC